MPRLNFGYLPRGSFRTDVMVRLFGEPNLLKRLQAGSIMDALAITPGERALDFGCASGYMTVELARAGAIATGIDVNPYVATIKVPDNLAGRLSFMQASGAGLPFEDNSFDVVLASEVLPMLPEPGPFLDEIRRVLKPGGRLVVPNGTGPRTLEEAYASKSPRLAALASRYPERMPKTYRDYTAAFQRVAGTLREDFMSEQDVLDALTGRDFRIARTFRAPSRRAGDWLAWHQFEHYLKTGKIVPELPFLPTFLYLNALSIGDREGYSGGLVVVAHAPAKD
jgi:ubiquinone/menaquinone biosynthesis C-methylase UbiE